MTQDLRVAVVSDSTPERNGVGSYYADLVSQLATRIERAELFCPEDRSDSWQRFLAPPLPGDKTQRIWFPRPFKLWSEVTGLQPDVIVVPTPGPFGLIGLAVAKRRGIPMVMAFHTHYEALTDIYWSDLFGRIARRYLLWSHRLFFRNSRVVLPARRTPNSSGRQCRASSWGGPSRRCRRRRDACCSWGAGRVTHYAFGAASRRIAPEKTG